MVSRGLGEAEPSAVHARASDQGAPAGEGSRGSLAWAGQVGYKTPSGGQPGRMAGAYRDASLDLHLHCPRHGWHLSPSLWSVLSILPEERLVSSWAAQVVDVCGVVETSGPYGHSFKPQDASSRYRSRVSHVLAALAGGGQRRAGGPHQAGFGSQAQPAPCPSSVLVSQQLLVF